MSVIKYKPLVDKLFWMISIPTVLLLFAVTVIACFDSFALFVIIPVDLFTLYFLISPLFGYAEFREKSLFVKFGFFMKREISYEKIRGAVKERKLYADSMLSLKNSIEHVNIKYNTFDIMTVSVVDNGGFVKELATRVEKTREKTVY